MSSSLIPSAVGGAGGAAALIPAMGGMGAGAGISELPALLKRWMALQEEMAAYNNEIKQRKTTAKALKDMILRIMESSHVAKLNVNRGAVVHTTREVTEKITNQYLLKHCKDFFGGDETRAQALVEYLESQRSSFTKHDLRMVLPKVEDDRP
jgi:hypothetical protein